MTRWLALLRLRCRSLFRGAAADKDLQRELDAHIGQTIDAHIAAGMSLAEARRAALVEFGSVTSVEEACRDTRRVRLLSNLVQDVRYATRTLARQPMLVVAATASIALGVGANLAIVALADDLLLSVPSAVHPDELVHIRTGNGSHVSYRGWQDLDGSHAIGGVAGYSIEDNINWRDGDASVTITPLIVTANFFDVVRMPIARGRSFTAAESDAGRDPRGVVISDRFWRARLSADPAVLGRTLTLNGQPYHVLGVLAAGIRSLPGFGVTPDVYLPLSRTLMPDIDDARRGVVQLIGRLAPGQSVAAGRAAFAVVAARLGEVYRDPGFRVLTNFSVAGGISGTEEFRLLAAFFLVLLVVGGLVLAIACANVAGLLLARSTSRRREIALRLALGASRGRLIQQLLTEGLTLSLIGTVIGGLATAVLAVWLRHLSLPVSLPFEMHPAFDGRLAVAALGLVAVSTLVCGLAPALQATRPGLTNALKQEDVRVGRRVTLRHALVMGQVAASLVLLVTAMLFVRNLAKAQMVRPGFDVDRVLVAQVTFVEGRQGSAAMPAVNALVDRVRALPGVESAAVAVGVPLTMRSGSTTGTDLVIEGHEGVGGRVRVDFDENVVGPGYFAAMGIRIGRGRDFSDADRAGAPAVVIITDEFARRYFARDNPIGRHIHLEGEGRTGVPEVIGIVGDSKYRTLGETQAAGVYEPFAQVAGRPRLVHLLVRTSLPEAMVVSVRDAILQVDGSAAVEVEPMTSALAFAFLPSQIGAALLGSLGILGALLAMVGLYGVIAFTVSRRTVEIGIRLALGASRSAVWRLVLAEAAVLVGAGLLAGLGVAALATRPLEAFLVAGLAAGDPISFFGTAVLLATVSLVATWAPARRAMRIDPSLALRNEQS